MAGTVHAMVKEVYTKSLCIVISTSVSNATLSFHFHIYLTEIIMDTMEKANEALIC